ncbi:hypothetical protein [Lacticaseibacillus suibinensis]|uniref:hypothetical protein n=1 Tax=Lacticaseibacillus suibinensis TaxID=2486011 RepID=UPI000F783F9B|nr:hypothetical protein [Lacticaseibacillus suibinensis]
MASEVKIRQIPMADLAIIDTEANEKGISREQYLRQLIHSHATNYYVDEERNSLAELITKNEKVLNETTAALNNFVSMLKSE